MSGTCRYCLLYLMLTTGEGGGERCSKKQVIVDKAFYWNVDGIIFVLYHYTYRYVLSGQVLQYNCVLSPPSSD